MTNEAGSDADIARRRLHWQCRRGMLELDDLLMGFLAEGYDSLSSQEQDHFSRLLKLQDAELLEYLMGTTTPADISIAGIVKKIRRIPVNNNL